MNDLFRPEVLAARREPELGSIQLSVPRMARLVAIVAFAIIALLCVLVLTGTYAQRTQAQGRIVPSGGLIDVAAPADGVVKRVLVAEGQLVAAGTPLLEISLERTSANSSTPVGELVGRQLDGQRRGLEADLATSDAVLARDTARLEAQLASLRQQLAVAGRRVSIREKQASDARATFEKIKPLVESRVVSGLQSSEYEMRALEAEAALDQAVQERLQVRADIATAAQELEMATLSAANRQRQIKRSLADVAQSAARNDGEGRILVRASRSGTVSALLPAPGQSCSSGQQLLALIPSGSTLQAELWVPGQAAGSLRVGSDVFLHYPAFPVETYGAQRGRVLEIASSASSPDDIRTRTGLALADSAYRVRVELMPPGEGSAAVIPRVGMPIGADLMLERRAVADMVFRPFKKFSETISD